MRVGGRDAKRDRGHGNDGVQQRRISLVNRNAVIPERKPGKVPPVIDEVTADGDEGGFGGLNARAVIEQE